MHSLNGNIAALLAVFMTVAAFLVRRPGGGAWWPTVVSGGIVVAEVLQIGFGFARTLSVHVPLGTAIIAAFVMLLIRVWRPVSAAPGAAPAPAQAVETADAR